LQERCAAATRACPAAAVLLRRTRVDGVTGRPWMRSITAHRPIFEIKSLPNKG